MIISMNFSPDIVEPYLLPIRLKKERACQHKNIKIKLNNPGNLPNNLSIKILPPDATLPIDLNGGNEISIPPDSEGFTLYGLYEYLGTISSEITSKLDLSIRITCGEGNSDIIRPLEINVKILPNNNSINVNTNGTSTSTIINQITNFGTLIKAEFVESIEGIIYGKKVSLPQINIYLKQNLDCESPVYGIPIKSDVFSIKQADIPFLSEGYLVYPYSVTYLGGGIAGENKMKWIFSSEGCGSDVTIEKPIQIWNQTSINQLLQTGGAYSDNNEINDLAESNGIPLDSINISQNPTKYIPLNVAEIGYVLKNTPNQVLNIGDLLQTFPKFTKTALVTILYPNFSLAGVNSSSNNDIDSYVEVNYPNNKSISYGEFLMNNNLKESEMDAAYLAYGINNSSIVNSGINPSINGIDTIIQNINKIALVFNDSSKLNVNNAISVSNLMIETNISSVADIATALNKSIADIDSTTEITKTDFLNSVGLTEETLNRLNTSLLSQNDQELAKIIQAVLNNFGSNNLTLEQIIIATNLTRDELSEIFNVSISALPTNINIPVLETLTNKSANELIQLRNGAASFTPPSQIVSETIKETLIQKETANKSIIDPNGANFAFQFNTNNTITKINLDNVYGFDYQYFDDLILKPVEPASIELIYLNWNSDPGQFILGMDNDDNVFYITAKIQRINCGEEIKVDTNLINQNNNFDVKLLPNIIITGKIQTFVFEATWKPMEIKNSDVIKFDFRNSCGQIRRELNVTIIQSNPTTTNITQTVKVLSNSYNVYDKPIIFDLNPLGIRNHDMVVKIDETQFQNCLNGGQFRMVKRVFNMLKDIQITIDGKTDEIVELKKGDSRFDINVKYTGSLNKINYVGAGGNINFNVDALCLPATGWSTIDQFINFPNPIQIKIIDSRQTNTQPLFYINGVNLKKAESFNEVKTFDIIINFKLIANYNEPVIIESANAKDLGISFNQNNVIIPNDGNMVIKMKYDGSIKNKTMANLQLKFRGGTYTKVRIIPLKFNYTDEEFTIQS